MTNLEMQEGIGRVGDNRKCERLLVAGVRQQGLPRVVDCYKLAILNIMMPGIHDRFGKKER
jgi:hypothetical protein